MIDFVSRRQFLAAAAGAGGLLAVLPAAGMAGAHTPPGTTAPLPVHLFSKHLQFLDYDELAGVAAELGFTGVDLTVRPDGHVRPEMVETQLPRAVAAIRKAGLLAVQITTGVSDAGSELDRRVLTTAAGLGITHYRLNWYHYPERGSLPDALRGFADQLAALSALNRELGLVGCYQNHAGQLVGASPWELAQLIDRADPAHLGVQYDIRHATVEGGLSWPTGFRLLASRIRSVVLKDMRWERVAGRGQVVDTPIGAGMVDFPAYFRLLRESGFRGAVVLHAEHPLGGAEHGARTLTVPPSVVYTALRQDLARVRALWAAI